MKVISRYFIIIASIIFSLIVSCDDAKKEQNTASVLATNSTTTKPALPTSEAFNAYWYAGKAELTSYELEQVRYGEVHKGKAVLVYVTEDFNPEKQVKADQRRSNNVPILKLNATKKFYTGIYPYSVMTSTFYPVANNQHAIKITSSMQEWCGHVFTQLNNREQFDVQSYSYFESESDRSLTLNKDILEDELWTQLRMDPTQLPIGDVQIVPAFEVLHMKHIPIQSYKATTTLLKTNETSFYKIEYPDLGRTLEISFNNSFPHDILGWTETFSRGGFNSSGALITKATRIKQLKSTYWSKNSVKDSIYKKELGL